MGRSFCARYLPDTLHSDSMCFVFSTTLERALTKNWPSEIQHLDRQFPLFLGCTGAECGIESDLSVPGQTNFSSLLQSRASWIF